MDYGDCVMVEEYKTQRIIYFHLIFFISSIFYFFYMKNRISSPSKANTQHLLLTQLADINERGSGKHNAPSLSVLHAH